MIKRRQFLSQAVGAIVSFPLLFSLCKTGEKNANVLLILTDDQGWGDISSHGNEILDTPNMDRIAKEGARFDRFYVSPVCAPTRASLLTGRYHLRTGVHGVTRGRESMRSEEVTLAEILKQNGYKTGCFGKWHNGAHFPFHPNGQGFDEFIGFCAGHWNNYFDTLLEHNGVEFRSQGYIADFLTDQAIHFITTNKNRPFFCYIPYNPPHSPFQVPDHYFNKYKNKGLENTLACVYAMCENLDDNIGRLLKTLDDLDLTEDTIVIFITDNGPNTDRYNGDMRGRKGSPHEGGSRVPCFIRWPLKISPGTVIKPIAAHIDVLPTLADLLGLPKADTLPLDGKSLVPLINNPQAEWQNRKIFGQWGNSGSVRTQQYRLVIKPSGTQLFDMIDDPMEIKDVSKKHPELYNQLQRELQVWMNRARQIESAYPVAIEIGHEEHSQVVLPGHEALLYIAHENGISYNGPNGWANDWVTNWIDLDSYPYWWIDVKKKGEYQFFIDYICAQENIGVEFFIEIDNKILAGQINQAFNPDPVYSPDRVERKEVYEKVWKTLDVGKMELNSVKAKLSIKVKNIPGNQAMDIKNLRIRKIG